MNSCSYCQIFTKVYRHPIKPNKVPERCWEKTCVDLFGKFPSKNHIVVIQDLASRYPTAKLVKSTSAKSIIPLYLKIFVIPLETRFDKKVTMNLSLILRKWKTLLKIVILNGSPGHGSPNNVETVMKPLGKAMKK